MIAAALDFVVLNRTPGTLFLHPEAFHAMEDCDLSYKVPSLKQCFTLSQVLHRMLTFSSHYIGGDSYMTYMTGYPEARGWFEAISDKKGQGGFYRHFLGRGPLRQKEFAQRALMCYLNFMASDGNEQARREKYVLCDLGEIFRDWQACTDSAYLRYKDLDDKIDLLEGFPDHRPNSFLST